MQAFPNRSLTRPPRSSPCSSSRARPRGETPRARRSCTARARHSAAGARLRGRDRGLDVRRGSCGGASNDELVDRARGRAAAQRRGRGGDAAGRPRRLPPRAPYDDTPQAIGHAATISARTCTRMHSKLLHEPLSRSAARREGPRRRLRLGLPARRARAARPRRRRGRRRRRRARVRRRRRPQLVELAERNLRKRDAALLDGRVVTLHTGDGWRGLAAEAVRRDPRPRGRRARARGAVAQPRRAAATLCPARPRGRHAALPADRRRRRRPRAHRGALRRPIRTAGRDRLGYSEGAARSRRVLRCQAQGARAAVDDAGYDAALVSSPSSPSRRSRSPRAYASDPTAVLQNPQGPEAVS